MIKLPCLVLLLSHTLCLVFPSNLYLAHPIISHNLIQSVSVDSVYLFIALIVIIINLHYCTLYLSHVFRW